MDSYISINPELEETNNRGLNEALKVVSKIDRILKRVSNEQEKANVIKMAVWEIVAIADKHKCLHGLCEVLENDKFNLQKQWFELRNFILAQKVHFLNCREFSSGTIFYIV